MKMINTILLIIAIVLLGISTINIVIYYKDIREIQSLTKEKLRLEIEKLKIETIEKGQQKE